MLKISRGGPTFSEDLKIARVCPVLKVVFQIIFQIIDLYRCYQASQRYLRELFILYWKIMSCLIISYAIISMGLVQNILNLNGHA